MSRYSDRVGADVDLNENEAAVLAGELLAEAQKLGENTWGVLVPEGATHKVVDLNDQLERLEANPLRAKGTVGLHTVDDLARYVTRHDDKAATTVWVDLHGHAVVAVLNDHGDAPGWGDHRAQLKLSQSPEWTRWKRHSGNFLDQPTFAEHIELSLDDIVKPDAADVLEMAQHIEGTASAEFQGGHRLQSGAVQLGYVETIDAKAGVRGELEIPKEFELALAPFDGEKPVPVRARFRFRLRGSVLQLGYVLVRPDDVLRASIDDITQRLANTFGEDRVFVGTPRA